MLICIFSILLLALFGLSYIIGFFLFELDIYCEFRVVWGVFSFLVSFVLTSVILLFGTYDSEKIYNNLVEKKTSYIQTLEEKDDYDNILLDKINGFNQTLSDYQTSIQEGHSIWRGEYVETILAMTPIEIGINHNIQEVVETKILEQEKSKDKISSYLLFVIIILFGFVFFINVCGDYFKYRREYLNHIGWEQLNNANDSNDKVSDIIKSIQDELDIALQENLITQKQ